MKRLILCLLGSFSIYAMDPTMQQMVDQLVRLKHARGNTALHDAAAQGHADLVRFICDKTAVAKDAPNKYGNTALHQASYGGHLLVVRELTKNQKMDPAQLNIFKENALHHAAEGGHDRLVRYYLRKHKNLDFRAKNIYGKTACELAAMKRYCRVVNHFIQVSGSKSRASESPFAQKGYCPVCLEHVPKQEYNVTSYSCMHFICSPCKKVFKAMPPAQRKCPLCRGPIG